MNIDEECRIERKQVEEYFAEYWKHASVLRNWFVAYGIGALALAIHNRGTFFTYPGSKEWFVGLIVTGITLQVLLTFLNKVVHWFVYYGKNLKIFQKTKRYKWSEKIVGCFIIDIVVDMLTIVAYGGAFGVFINNL